MCASAEKNARNKQTRGGGGNLVQAQGVAWLALFSMGKEIDRQQEKNK